jgi:hypothetical protein
MKNQKKGHMIWFVTSCAISITLHKVAQGERERERERKYPLMVDT